MKLTESRDLCSPLASGESEFLCLRRRSSGDTECHSEPNVMTDAFLPIERLSVGDIHQMLTRTIPCTVKLPVARASPSSRAPPFLSTPFPISTEISFDFLLLCPGTCASRKVF